MRFERPLFRSALRALRMLSSAERPGGLILWRVVAGFFAILVLAVGFQAQAQVVATNVQAIVEEGTPLSVIDVMANDTDANYFPLTVTAVSAAAHGASSLPQVGGQYALYQPAQGYVGPDSFTYTVSDGHGGVATGAVSITVAPLPPIPAVNRISAPVVMPSVALAYYGNATTRTPDPAWALASPEIAALARSLGAGRSSVSATQYSQNAYDYIRNNVATEFRFGLGKGARGALIDQSGTPFDQAELMMKLLAVGNVSAQYQLGQITLTPQQFGQWTGLVTGLNQATQTFVVNAQTACQFLADGGIPAIINGVQASGGSNYCSAQVSGNLSSVTLLHIWVATTANSYLFDPSFKRNILKTGIDLAAGMGCGSAAAPTCAASTGTSLLTGAMSGVQTGTLGPAAVPYIKNVNEAAALSQMTTYATALQNTILGTNPAAALQDVIGGGVIDTTYAPVAGTVLPYASSVSLTWNNGIPDQYRTSFSYAFCGQTVNVAADEMAGRRLRQYMTKELAVYGNTSLQGVNPFAVISTYVDDVDVFDCNVPYGAPPNSPVTTLTVKPPYAALAGAYGQSSLSTFGGSAFAVQLGESSDASIKFMGDLQEADPNPFSNNGDTLPASGMMPCNSNQYYPWCHLESQTTSLQRVFTQQSRAEYITSAISNAAMRHHARLGYLSGGALSISSTISDESIVGDSPDVDMEYFSHISSAIEGSAGQQQGNTWEPQSGTTNFVLSNRNGTQILDINPGSMAATFPYLSNYVYPIGYGGPISISRTLNLQTLANSGYESIIPQNACIDLAIYGGAPGSAPCNGEPISPDYEFQAGSVGMLLGETYKGAVDPATDALAQTKRATESQLSASQGYSFDAASGQISLHPSPDIVTGSGPFPESLPFQRTYQSGIGVREEQYVTTSSSPVSVATYSGPDSDSASHLGAGWQHNYQITAQIVSDGSIALGQYRGVDATAFIAGAYVDYQLLRTPTFQTRVAALFVDYWMTRQIFQNTVHIKNGASAMDFDRMPSGAFNPPPGVAGQLVQTAAPVLVAAYGAPAYDYTNVGLRLTNRDGSVIAFDNSLINNQPLRSLIASIGTPQFKADSWSFPNGIAINFQYTPESINNGNDSGNISGTNYVLTSVSNNLGRSLTFANTILRPQSGAGGGQIGWVINSVADESGRVASFALSNCPVLQNQASGAGERGNAELACNTLTVTEPQVGTTATQWTYGYAPGSDSPDPATISKPAYHLRRWYTPGNQTTAYETVAYDPVFRTATATDILGHVVTYYPTALATTEGWKRTDEVDPIGNTSTKWFDGWNDLIQSKDALGRMTTYSYDGLHRKILETHPELDQMATAYDVRSNVIQQTRIPKPGSGLAPTVASTAYNEGPTVVTCVNAIICNEPASQTDARGYVTNLTYNTTTGQLTQALKPADASGVRPETDLAYTSLNGISFLTSKIDKITSTLSTTTAYAYNAANKYTLQTATVDSGGLALRTCFKFDTMGNLISVSDPRAASCP